jgi:hypothetical protein
MAKQNHDMREESKKIIVQYALFRWENAVILASTIILTAFLTKPFSWWPVWGWPLIGLIGMGAIFYSSLTNTETNARILLLAYQDKFDLKKIKLPELREEIRKALEYQRRIESYLSQQDDSPLWGRAQETANQVRHWIDNVFELAQHLDL